MLFIILVVSAIFFKDYPSPQFLKCFHIFVGGDILAPYNSKCRSVCPSVCKIQNYTCEFQGLDIVRRDWSQFAADAGKAIIDIIMTDKSEDLRLSQIQEHLEVNKY